MGAISIEEKSYLLIYKNIVLNIDTNDVEKYFFSRYYKKCMYFDMHTYVQLRRGGHLTQVLE